MDKNNVTPNWYLTLPEAIKIQANWIGVELIVDELAELKSFVDVKNNAKFNEDFQLDIGLTDKDLLNLPVPCIIELKKKILNVNML